MLEQCIFCMDVAYYVHTSCMQNYVHHWVLLCYYLLKLKTLAIERFLWLFWSSFCHLKHICSNLWTLTLSHYRLDPTALHHYMNTYINKFYYCKNRSRPPKAIILNDPITKLCFENFQNILKTYWQTKWHMKVTSLT